MVDQVHENVRAGLRDGLRPLFAARSPQPANGRGPSGANEAADLRLLRQGGPTVWAKSSKVPKPVALSQSTNIAEAAEATMEAWLEHINDNIRWRHELVTEDVHLMVLSQNLDRATTHDGIDDVLSFFHTMGHAFTAREFLSVEPGAFAIEMMRDTRVRRMGADIFEVNGEGKIFDIKVWMATFRNDTTDFNDTGLTEVANGVQARISAESS